MDNEETKGEESLEVDETTEKVEETVDYKAELEKLTQENGSLKRDLKKATKTVKEPTDSQPTELDYGAKAYLATQGINNKEDVSFVQETMTDTGKTLEEVLENSYFKSELENRAELRKTAEAIPEGGENRGGNTNDTVEYWIAKGELPPKENKELRRKVVNAKMNTVQSADKFTNHPIVS